MSRKAYGLLLVASLLGLGSDTVFAGSFTLSILNKDGTETVVSAPYPKWYFDAHEADPGHLTFRLFGYEGMARNLFVLTCQNNKATPVTIEIIPPKGLEEALRDGAAADLVPTTITFSSDDTVLLTVVGEYDKISAFVDLAGADSLVKFLQLFEYQKLQIQWNPGNMKYLLMKSTVYIDQFSKEHRSNAIERFGEELSYQDVYIRCSKLAGS